MILQLKKREREGEKNLEFNEEMYKTQPGHLITV